MINIYKDGQATARAFAEWLAERINEKNTYIALSGGSTPNLLFELLGQEFAFDIKWQNAHLFWGDERCVPPFDPQSNYLSAKTRMIDLVAIPSENVHRIRGEGDPEKEAIRYSQRIKTLVPEVDGLPKFDVVLLGLGTDGHTASIFPDQMNLLTSDNLCDVAQHPDSGQNRITITGKVINHAQNIVFLVTGESKADKVAEIIGGDKSSNLYPASHIKPANGELKWFLDEAAAVKIKK